MEVKIGVQYSSRELVLDSDQPQDEVEKAVAKALAADEGVLTLADRKGRRFIVPAAKVAYVEIAETESRPVGFVAS